MRNKVLALLIGLNLAAMVKAQDFTCNSGDIAWVSSAINANVGLAAGAGRCLANTVAGAAYNDPTMGWGIQAAIDCGCAGLTIAIRGDTGNYGSLTNSWNNRFDGNKQIQVTGVSGGVTAPISIVGYPTTATNCALNNTAAGCPVEVNFSAGLTDGFNFVANNYNFLGVHIRNATDDCIVSSGDNLFMGGLEIDGCLNTAFEKTSSGESALVRSYIHDTGDNAADVAVRIIGSDGHIFAYNYVTGTSGPALEYTSTGIKGDHNIFFDIGGDCILVGGTSGVWRWNTLRDCGGDGFTLQSGAANSTRTGLLFNLITGASGWAIDSIGSAGTRPTAMIAYNVMGSNGLGDINPTREPVSITLGNVEGATVTYAGGSDFTPDGAQLTLLYPSGGTEITINAGAVVEGGGALGAGGGGLGAGGVYIPGGPR